MEHAEREACEVYAPRSVQFLVWRSMVDWVVFFLQIIMQMVPSLPHLFSYIRFPNSSSSSSHAADAINSNHINFKPLPVVEIPLQPPPSSTSSFSSTSDSDVSVLDDGDLHLRKLTIVLDLDETLVCAYETSSLPEIVRTQAIQAGLKWFELECVSSEKECDGKPKINYVTVFERPGLHDFLKGVAEFANLVLFTAGLEDYARPLVDRIDKDNLISLRLYRPSTVSTAYREHVKDLSYISKDLCRIVIVDNNPFSFLLHPLNGIPCIPFSAGQPYDNQLLEVLLPLLKHLSLQKDVRPVLHERFRMAEWFQMHGIPASAITMLDEESACEQTKRQQQLR